MFGLKKKEDVFYTLFIEYARKIEIVGEKFLDLIEHYENVEEKVEKIKVLETECDMYAHDILNKLNVAFITPFDREDIHSLATSLDDIADYIYASAKYIFLYKSPKTEAYQEFSLLIYKACIEIQNAIKNFKDFKDLEAVKESCIKINSIENIADDVQSSALIKLFETNDPINIIKVQQVLNYLEEVTDKAEDVANVLDSIIIKYA